MKAHENGQPPIYLPFPFEENLALNFHPRLRSCPAPNGLWFSQTDTDTGQGPSWLRGATWLVISTQIGLICDPKGDAWTEKGPHAEPDELRDTSREGPTNSDTRVTGGLNTDLPR